MSGFLWMALTVLAAVLLLRAWGGGSRLRAKVEEASRRATEAAARRAGAIGEDMAECRVCGTYRAVSATDPCGREDCPYRER
ncbi:MAG: hypothetical protein ACLFV8_14025 [Alphaproteobacteria bacterium]